MCCIRIRSRGNSSIGDGERSSFIFPRFDAFFSLVWLMCVSRRRRRHSMVAPLSLLHIMPHAQTVSLHITSSTTNFHSSIPTCSHVSVERAGGRNWGQTTYTRIPQSLVHPAQCIYRTRLAHSIHPINYSLIFYKYGYYIKEYIIRLLHWWVSLSFQIKIKKK